MARKRKLDPSVLRVGDKVKIVIPEVFIRCGYPFTTKDTLKLLPKIVDIQIKNIIKQCDLPSAKSDYLSEALLDSTIHDIKYILARRLLQQLHWGGPERKIYTRNISKLQNIIGVVRDKRVVKTGIYEAGEDYGDGDFDPPHLKDEQTHIIYSVNIDPEILSWNWFADFSFEKRCLVKV